MTDKDTLMNLIDEYAEARHINGCWVYNIKTAAARQAVIEALSGVQALSAAPASPWSRALEIRMAQGWRLKGDRIPVLYTDTINGDGVGRDDLWLCTTEALAAPPAPPAEQPIGELVVTKTRDGQIVSVTRQDDEGRILSVIATSAPEEQQAQPGAVYAELPESTTHQIAELKACEHGDAIVGWRVEPSRQSFHASMHPKRTLYTTEQARNFADRTHALRMQQAAPKAAPGVGNSGFDHQTAADFLSGKTVSDESVRKFVQASRWAHDEKASLSAMLLSVRGELASRNAEIALLKRALMEAEAAPQQEVQEPFAWESTTPGYIKYITQARYEKFSPKVQRWYKPYKCSSCAAPQPAPAPLSDDTERLEWLLWKLPGGALRYVVGELADTSSGAEFRAAIDAALAAQGGKA